MGCFFSCCKPEKDNFEIKTNISNTLTRTEKIKDSYNNINNFDLNDYQSQNNESAPNPNIYNTLNNNIFQKRNEDIMLHISNGTNIFDWIFNRNDKIKVISEKIQITINTQNQILLIYDAEMLMENEIIKNKLKDDALIIYSDSYFPGGNNL